MLHVFALVLFVSLPNKIRSARPRYVEENGVLDFRTVGKKPLRAGMWSLAAASSNPFEFIPNSAITTGVSEADATQQAVNQIIETLQEAMELEGSDEPIINIFKQEMFDEFLQSSRAVLTEFKNDWQDEELTKHWNVLKNRKVLNQYITDPELDLGYSRILSWPDRFTNTLKTGQCRPTVINCYNQSLTNDNWWRLWKSFMFQNATAWKNIEEMPENYKDMILPIAVQLDGDSTAGLDKYDFGLRKGSFAPHYLPRDADLRKLEWPVILSKQTYYDTADDIKAFEGSQWEILLKYPKFTAACFPLLQRNQVSALGLLDGKQRPTNCTESDYKAAQPESLQAAKAEVGDRNNLGVLLEMAAEAQTKLKRILGPQYQQAHTFKPGRMGIEYDEEGAVKNVVKGAPADVKGIKPGDKIVEFALDGAAQKTYSKVALDSAETGTSGYTVTFLVSQPWEERWVGGSVLRTTTDSPFAELAVDPGLKGIPRIYSKANFKYEASHGTERFRRVLDMARFSLIYDSCESLLKGLEKLRKDKRIKVVDIENRFGQETGLGWRDVQLLVAVKVRNNTELHIGEIQMTHVSMSNARKGLHRHFAFVREFLPDIKQKDGKGHMKPDDVELVLNTVDSALARMRKEEDEKKRLEKKKQKQSEQKRTKGGRREIIGTEKKSNVIPVRKQLLHLAIYDAIAVHAVTRPTVSEKLTQLANFHSDLQVSRGNEFSDARAFVCSKSIQLKERSALGVLAGYLRGFSVDQKGTNKKPNEHERDVMFLTNVNLQQAKSLAKTLKKTYYTVGPRKRKGSKQNAVILIAKERFQPPQPLYALELKLNPKRFPDYNLVFAVTRERGSYRPFIFGAFAARKEGRDSLTVMDKAKEFQKSRGGALVLGFTSNTFTPKAIKAPMGFLLEGVEEFLWKSGDDSLKSIFDGKEWSETITTNRGRSFLQPQLQDAVRLQDYETSVGVDRNPKDHILYDPGLLVNRCNLCDKDEITRHNRADPSKPYDVKATFPTAEFPSTHALVEASFWTQAEFRGEKTGAIPPRVMVAENGM